MDTLQYAATRFFSSGADEGDFDVWMVWGGITIGSIFLPPVFFI